MGHCLFLDVTVRYGGQGLLVYGTCCPSPQVASTFALVKVSKGNYFTQHPNAIVTLKSSGGKKKEKGFSGVLSEFSSTTVQGLRHTFSREIQFLCVCSLLLGPVA